MDRVAGNERSATEALILERTSDHGAWPTLKIRAEERAEFGESPITRRYALANLWVPKNLCHQAEP